MTPQVIGSILLGADDLVAELVASRILHMRHKSFGQCVALGVIQKEYLIGGVVYHEYRGHDVQVSAAFDKIFHPLPLRALCDYPFNTLNCARVTMIVGRQNRKARKIAEAFGFKLEGVHHKGLDGFEDAFSYGMLKEHCRWLKGRNHGLLSTTTAAAA